MGQSQSKQLNFEDVQEMIKNKNNIIINVLPETEQQCLIKNTLNVKLEVNTINELLKNKGINVKNIKTNLGALIEMDGDVLKRGIGGKLEKQLNRSNFASRLVS